MSTEDERKLFIAGLPDSITEDVLRQLFEATGGTVVNVTLPKHRDTGRPRGFGFVTLSTAEEAASARDALDGSVQAGRAISVRPFQSEPPKRDARSESPAAQSGDRTLYVGNLPYDTTQAEIEEVFSTNGAGPIVRVHLPVGPDGRMRGFGFITLGSADAATSAIVALRDVEMRGRRLMINIAHPRGERPAGASAPPRRSDDMGGGGGGRSFPPRESFADPNTFVEPAKPVEGRRWRDAPAESAAKKKKKKARGERAVTPDRQRREKNKRWNDWDDD